MKKLLLLTLVLLGGVMQVSAATETTVYYAVPSSVVGTYTVKLKVNRQSEMDNSETYTMEKTTKTYDGKYIYKCTYTDLYNGVSYMLFQLYNGDTWVSEDCSVGYPEGGGIHWVWTAASTYNGKLHVHGTGNSNSGTPWVTYNTDGLKGNWDSWLAKREFENGQLTIDFNSGEYKEFKIEIGGTLYGAQTSGATMFWNNCTDWTLDGSNNCKIQTSATGTYTFTLAENKKVSVTFPAYTGTKVYFYNTVDWSAPYAYILTGKYWDDSKGSGSNNQPNGVAMTQVGSSNVYEAEYPAGANSGYIAFINTQQNGYGYFWETEAIYKTDFPNTPCIYVPNASGSSNYKNEDKTKYYYDGAWHAYPTYTRSTTEGKFGTICLPFNATVTGATVYKIVSKTVDGGDNLTGINLEEVNSLEAGKAYIFKGTGSDLVATYSGSYTAATDANGMLGNLSSTKAAVPENNYIVKDNQIRKVVSGGSGVTVGQYKAYITLTGINVAQARGIDFIAFNDGEQEQETDGINAVKLNAENGATYNLAGQRVSKDYKGIVIVNGKKMVNK